CAILKEWSDAVLFATRRMRIERDGDRTRGLAIGAGAGERIIKTEGGPACVAKNRYNMPIEIPLAWDAVCEAITKSQAPVAPPATPVAQAE
ncbi:MAG: hypothetical protein FWG74_08940, partial [Planctomycetes bacterium]|nr:hypothetical protein [Planctomycetota bacterium]